MKLILLILITMLSACGALTNTASPLDALDQQSYQSALYEFTHADLISKSDFQPLEPAKRSDFLRLIVMMNGGILAFPQSRPSFVDVPPSSSEFDWFEEAAGEWWLLGDGKCLGENSCFARPNDPINYAEAAALIVRSFGLLPDEVFQTCDVPADHWYSDSMMIAEANCLLHIFKGGRSAEASAALNKAEMITMLWRIDQHRKYPDCVSESSSST